MTDTTFNEAIALFARPEIRTYESEQQALLANMQRLKQQRLEREAAGIKHRLF